MSSYEKIDFNELEQKLKDEVSIEAVHSLYNGGYVNKSGTMSECPFCGVPNRKLYKTPGETFKCYSGCNEGRVIDIFSYYKLKFNVDFGTAKICLARDFGYMKPETAERLLKSKGNVTTYIPKKQNKDYVKPVEKETVPKQSPEVIHNVYNAIARRSRLKEDQFFYLLDIRNLDEKRIRADYFNLPYMKGKEGRQFMDVLLADLKSKFGYEEKDLIGVPGFYMDENNRMMFCNNKGIGMKARKADGTVNGIQIRNYDYIKKDGDLHINNPKYKYLWVTSRDLNKGVAAGAAIDVIVPEGPLHTTVIITEGKFKAEIIAKRFSSPVVSVQGVGQWKGVLEPEIDYINEHVRKIKNIAICFDGDLGTNLDVYRNLSAMAKKLKENKCNANIKMGVWDQRFGKGLDDVILSGNDRKIKNIEYDKYCEKYEEFKSEIEKNYNIKAYKVYYRDTNEEVNKDELFKLYIKHVLVPLDIELAN